ncbi:septum site-determining protein MinC [Paenibacillus psychroresistens]|uniref:Probable septum site-determining protein MinC n=1 Tax=Paenibacillus psychroresistens TaxID=1778678 RepID=A0A6B8RI28_9BACL|nr:septum site-determining protein MinC [Paenibacillus psychroresistens]QGQ95394.1 septum site-determining protein MinC [Paenibacillus psychroresistens]
MTVAKNLVTIKGVKDGLVFILNDNSLFVDVIKELQHKLEKTHRKILFGPLVHVQVRLGKRQLVDVEKEQIRELIKSRGNLIVQSIESDLPEATPIILDQSIKMIYGMIRSGQTIQHEGKLMLMGDVNPGGIIECTGDIYIMGSLRGMAHAGINGDQTAIIAASHLRPTQLRIAEVISRPPDEWGIEEAFMEFAYIRNGVMEIDKINQLQHVRPDNQ